MPMGLRLSEALAIVLSLCGSSPISVGGKLLDEGITMRGSWKKSRSKNVR